MTNPPKVLVDQLSQVTVPLPNISLTSSRTIKDGLEATLGDSKDVAHLTPAIRRLSVVEDHQQKKMKVNKMFLGNTKRKASEIKTHKKPKKVRSKALTKSKKKRKYNKARTITTESTPFVFYPTPHPDQQKSYTYILNHTELVPLQPEAPEPIFWNEKALKLKVLGESANQEYNGFSKTSNTKPKEKDYKKIMMPGTQKPKLQQSNRRSSLIQKETWPGQKNKWRYSKVTKEHELILPKRNVKGIERGKVYGLRTKERYPVIQSENKPSLLRYGNAMGSNMYTEKGVKKLTKTFSNQPRYEGQKKGTLFSTRTPNPVRTTSFPTKSMRRQVGREMVEAFQKTPFPSVEYGFVPSPASRSSLESKRRNSIGSSQKKLIGAKTYPTLDGNVSKRSRPTKRTQFSHTPTTKKTYRIKDNLERYLKSTNDMKLLDYFRNEYSIPKERSKSDVSLSRKELLGIPRNMSSGKSSGRKSSLKVKASDETLISSINHSDDGLFMTGYSVSPKKAEYKNIPPRRTSKVKYENKDATSIHGSSGDEKVYIVYPDSSKGSHLTGEQETYFNIQLLQGHRTGRTSTKVFRGGGEKGSEPSWGYFTAQPGDFR